MLTFSQKLYSLLSNLYPFTYLCTVLKQMLYIRGSIPSPTEDF